MHLTYEEHDFCGENAVRTARIMRAVANVLDPNPSSQPVTIRHVLGDAAVSATAPTVAQALEALHGNSGTVATHVSAEAVGDVPFPESGGDFTPEQLAAPIGPGTYIQMYGRTKRDNGSVVLESAPPQPAGVDSEGYPWDERIHASSRNTVADGTWRKKRGVDDALVASVRAEWDAKLRPAPAPEATRYWHHPESSCVFKTEPGEPIGTDGCVEEVDEAAYLQLEREYASQRAPAAPTEAERLQADHVSTMPVPWATAAVPADTINPAAVGFGAQVPPPPPPPAAAASDWPDEILGPRTDTMAPFPQFLTWANRQITAGTLDNARLLDVLREHGVPVITALAAPDHAGKIPAIARQLAGA